MEDLIAETAADDIEGTGVKLEPTKIAARFLVAIFGRVQRLDASKPEERVTDDTRGRRCADSLPAHRWSIRGYFSTLISPTLSYGDSITA
jgi:hypothetical protein